MQQGGIHVVSLERHMPVTMNVPGNDVFPLANIHESLPLSFGPGGLSDRFMLVYRISFPGYRTPANDSHAVC